jgi:prevent-host-death family protein
MTIRTLDVSEATRPLADYVQQACNGPVVVTVDGRPVAVVAAIEDEDVESLALSESAQFWALIERARASQRLSESEVWQRVADL